MPPRAEPQTERLAFLEGMRAVAALFVVVGHFASMADPSLLAGKASEAPRWLQVLFEPLWYGHLAVAAFLVISGFCLPLSLYQSGTGRLASIRGFYARRARRILPAYYAALAFSLVVAFTVTRHQEGSPWTLYLPVTWENTLAHVFLVHNFHPDWMYKINGVLWSIAIEFQLYLVFPLIMAVLAKWGRGAVLGISLAISLALFFSIPNAPKLYSWYLALFCFGVVAAHFAYRPHLRIGPQPGVARLVLAVGGVGGIIACSTGATMMTRDLLVGAATAAAAYLWTVSPGGRAPRILSARPLVAIGGFSYSLYLMHHPIQQVLFVHRPAFVQGILPEFLYLLVLGLPVILLSCWLFSLVFERPFLPRRTASEGAPVRVPVPVRLPLKPYGRLSP